MPRGGRREGAGRKTKWESGCTFAETVVIRVPGGLKNEILELAHRLDAGEQIAFDSDELRERNEFLEARVTELEGKLQETQPQQLSLFPTDEFLTNLKANVLSALKMGTQSKAYKRVEQAIEKEIGKLI